MSSKTALISAEKVRPGVSVRVEANGRYYIVCNDQGTYYVADLVCPHAGGALAGAEVSDGCVVCPVHYWPWNLKTGLTDENLPELRLGVYPCEVRDGTVYADLSSSPPPSLPPDLDCRCG
jgi:nitrite reductase/ring-hydroxylating ferredoxin subunit